jgi:uncharacterized protein YukE
MFDKALDQLGIALEGDGFAELAAVFGSLSAAANEIADALEQADQISQAGCGSACRHKRIVTNRSPGLA